MVEKDVGQGHDPDAEPVIQSAVDEERLDDRAAEPAGRPFLDRDENLMLARKPQDEIDVERLGEARVGDGGREPPRFEVVRRLQRFG